MSSQSAQYCSAAVSSGSRMGSPVLIETKAFLHLQSEVCEISGADGAGIPLSRSVG